MNLFSADSSDHTKLWPADFNIREGFSPEQLERICSEEFGRREGSALLNSPWLFWSSELYSHGRCLREWLRWPKQFPIPAFSDHGVNPLADLSGPEITNESFMHLTWSSWRSRQRFSHGKLVVQIPHPWVTFRQRRGLKKKSEASGLLVFIPHSLPNFDYPQYNWRSYLNMLKKDNMRPGALMIGMHDVRAGKHIPLYELGIPILSAGNTESPLFVERFYDIVSNFEQATSNSVGSQSFFCHEMGVHYFVAGEPQELPAEIASLFPWKNGPYFPEADKLFRNRASSKDIELSSFVDEALGLNVNQFKAKWVVRILLLTLLVPTLLSKVLTKISARIRLDYSSMRT